MVEEGNEEYEEEVEEDDITTTTNGTEVVEDTIITYLNSNFTPTHLVYRSPSLMTL